MTTPPGEKPASYATTSVPLPPLAPLPDLAPLPPLYKGSLSAEPALDSIDAPAVEPAPEPAPAKPLPAATGQPIPFVMPAQPVPAPPWPSAISGPPTWPMPKVSAPPTRPYNISSYGQSRQTQTWGWLPNSAKPRALLVGVTVLVLIIIFAVSKCSAGIAGATTPSTAVQGFLQALVDSDATEALSYTQSPTDMGGLFVKLAWQGPGLGGRVLVLDVWLVVGGGRVNVSTRVTLICAGWLPHYTVSVQERGV